MTRESAFDGPAGVRRELRKHTAEQSGKPWEPRPGQRAVAVGTPSSRKLQDLASFRRDFEAAQLYADAYVAVADERPNLPYAAQDAFWIAAVVTYARAFTKGVRVERPSVDAYTDTERVQHQRLLELRDKHLAHAVNNYEHVQAIAYLTDSAFVAREVLEVGQMNHEASLIDAADAAVVGDLCRKQLQDLTRRIGELQHAVGNELLAMDIDDVYKFPDVTSPTFDMNNPTKRR